MAAAAVTGRIYRRPEPERLFVVARLGWSSWWSRASARCSPRARSPSTPTRAGSARARRHQLGRRVPRPSPRRRHRARRGGRLRAVAVRPAVHVRPHGRRPAPVVPLRRRPEVLPHPVLGRVRARARGALRRDRSARLACNYYRDGRDSVAPHGDRELRDIDDTARRAAHAGRHPPVPAASRTGARAVPAHDLAPGSGDLLVMGGACQRDWEHGVPKVRSAGPRVSVMWRWVRRPTPEAFTAQPAAARGSSRWSWSWRRRLRGGAVGGRSA